MTTNWRELFPTKLTFLIFILYMSLFIGQGKNNKKIYKFLFTKAFFNCARHLCDSIARIEQFL